MVTRLGPHEVLSGCDQPLGAYVHVPFCTSICPFCPYNKVVARDDLAERYFAALAIETEWYVAAARACGIDAFTSLYVGGGTPTLYPRHLAAIVAAIPVSGERAVEVLPNHGTPRRLDELAAMGFSAVSIGAQSFHDDVLRRLHRPHDAAAGLAAVRHARERFSCVDVDLIVDATWDRDPTCAGAFLHDVSRCLDLGVAQVSTYPLMRFGYTPFGTARHDRRHEHAVLAQAAHLARQKGYERRSVWTLNRMGTPSYTSITRRRFLGMGAGSASFTGQDFYVNHFGLDPYIDDVHHGRLPIARWLHLGRSAGGLYDAFWQAYGGQVQGSRRVIASVASSVGLLRPTADGYRLTERGFDVYHDLERVVTYQLIEPLWAQMLTEHDGAGSAGWAQPDRARSGRAWTAASRLFERPRVA